MCIFCKIINNEIPSSKIYEDEYVLAILDISQATYGHTLVIPKKHYENMFDIDDVTFMHISKIINMLVKKYKVLLNIENVNILNNSGSLAGQVVNHLHFHIIPRYSSDDVTIKFNNNEYNLKEIENKLKG